MSREDWQALVLRYADGRTPCNCGDAYYIFDEMGRPYCRYGCTSSKLQAKEEIAGRVLAELPPAKAD